MLPGGLRRLLLVVPHLLMIRNINRAGYTLVSKLHPKPSSSLSNCSVKLDVFWKLRILLDNEGLVLDFSYRPVNIVCWKRATRVGYMEKADVLECYDRVEKLA
ncbi:hypothetical protein Droror1_Dr00022049 [Drosera rotundifolia]